MNTRPRMYADFDGVINADHPRFDEVVSKTVSINEGGGMRSITPIVFAPALTTALDAIIVDFDVELVWASTWNEKWSIRKATSKMRAMHSGRIMKHDSMPMRFPGISSEVWTAWKADEIIAEMTANPAPFVWFDDEAIPCHGERVKAATAGIPSLFISPEEEHGLTAEDIATMRDFYASLS